MSDNEKDFAQETNNVKNNIDPSNPKDEESNEKSISWNLTREDMGLPPLENNENKIKIHWKDALRKHFKNNPIQFSYSEEDTIPWNLNREDMGLPFLLDDYSGRVNQEMIRDFLKELVELKNNSTSNLIVSADTCVNPTSDEQSKPWDVNRQAMGLPPLETDEQSKPWDVNRQAMGLPPLETDEQSKSWDVNRQAMGLPPLTQDSNESIGETNFDKAKEVALDNFKKIRDNLTSSNSSTTNKNIPK